MDKCNECSHARFKRGTSRGVMDCDPDEYWCDVDQDEYFCADDDELRLIFREDYIEQLVKEGIDLEKAKEEADEIEFDIDCPDFNESDDYEPDPDYLYDLWRYSKYEEKTL